MNAIAEELVAAVRRHFPGREFVVAANEDDPLPEPGSVVLRCAHPQRAQHQVSITQRGNTVEVAYSDGSPPGPAEALFVFQSAIDCSAAIKEAVEFLERIFGGDIIVYRERIGGVSRWLRGDNVSSLFAFWFGTGRCESPIACNRGCV